MKWGPWLLPRAMRTLGLTAAVRRLGQRYPTWAPDRFSPKLIRSKALLAPPVRLHKRNWGQGRWWNEPKAWQPGGKGGGFVPLVSTIVPWRPSTGTGTKNLFDPCLPSRCYISWNYFTIHSFTRAGAFSNVYIQVSVTCYMGLCTFLCHLVVPVSSLLIRRHNICWKLIHFI